MTGGVDTRATGAVPFGERLVAATTARGPLCVGVDPHPALLRSWGLGDDVAGLERFTMTAVEALAGGVAVVKPQSAFYERFGSAGIGVLERGAAAARALGALVLLDVKRGDIGSTMQAYAAAYLDPSSPLAVDAITVSPFLGLGSLDPAFDTAARYGGGVLVLALTSNPEGPQVQHARTEDGRSVAGAVLDGVRTRNRTAGHPPAGPGSLGRGRSTGSYGAVVGATIGGTDEDLAVGGPLLVPGIGVQGGTVESVQRVFGAALPDVLPSISREILATGPDAASLSRAALRAGASYAELLDR